MGFFDAIGKVLGSKEKTSAKGSDAVILPGKSADLDKNAMFSVDSVHPTSQGVMVSGRVMRGAIKKGMKTKIGKNEVAVLDVQAKFRSTDLLKSGDKGALFLKASNRMVNAGDVLKF